MVGIYAITNIANGKRYIGSSKGIEHRWSEHVHRLERNVHINKHLQAAWNKYGSNAFTFVVLVECSVDALLEWEQAYLDEWQPEYNIAISAEHPMLGRHHSEDTRRKMSESHSHDSDETRHKKSEASKGKHPPSFKGKRQSLEARAKIGAAQRGKVNSIETRRKMSESHRRKE